MLLAIDAMLDAGLFGARYEPRSVATLVAGHNINEMYAFENRTRFEEEPEWIDSMLSLNRLDTDHGGCVSEVLGHKGPLYTVGAACASGNVALRLAVDEIRHRGQDVALVAAPVLEFNPMELHAMAIMGAIAYQAFNEAPAQASRPWDARREGFVPAHGGGCLVVESLAHARRRGAKIHAEVLAIDASSDGCHLPTPSADGQIALVRKVLAQAGLAPEQIDYVNAHATSTPLGDVAEAQSIKAVFGAKPRLKVNAPKSMLGHCCWSAPTVETIAAVLQMNAGRLHPSINIETLDDEVTFDVCRDGPREHEVRYLVKNSFGFGGINSVSVLGRFDEAT
jgi:3-oxoacyl-(acyl-carrier-protein) synthase